jgi:hypothetical protein
MQIVMASIRERDIGLVCHSRVSDLRTQGYVITCGIEGKTRKGRDRYLYRLVSEPAMDASGVTTAPPAPAVRAPHTSTAPTTPDVPAGEQLVLA